MGREQLQRDRRAVRDGNRVAAAANGAGLNRSRVVDASRCDDMNLTPEIDGTRGGRQQTSGVRELNGENRPPRDGDRHPGRILPRRQGERRRRGRPVAWIEQPWRGCLRARNILAGSQIADAECATGVRRALGRQSARDYGRPALRRRRKKNIGGRGPADENKRPADWLACIGNHRSGDRAAGGRGPPI